MANSEVNCNGGFLDMIDWLNQELSKQDKKKMVIGFERDKKNPKHIRFFDKNNRTVWMPDHFYKKFNIEAIRMGGLRVGRFESQRWKKIATGQCTDIGSQIQLKLREITGKITNVVGSILTSHHR